MRLFCRLHQNLGFWGRILDLFHIHWQICIFSMYLLKMEEYSQWDDQWDQWQPVTNHDQVEVSHRHLGKEQHFTTELSRHLTLNFFLTVPWCVVLAWQLVKFVHVRLLSGWRHQSPVSVQTLDASAEGKMQSWRETQTFTSRTSYHWTFHTKHQKLSESQCANLN